MKVHGCFCHGIAATPRVRVRSHLLLLYSYILNLLFLLQLVLSLEMMVMYCMTDLYWGLFP